MSWTSNSKLLASNRLLARYGCVHFEGGRRHRRRPGKARRPPPLRNVVQQKLFALGLKLGHCIDGLEELAWSRASELHERLRNGNAEVTSEQVDRQRKNCWQLLVVVDELLETDFAKGCT